MSDCTDIERDGCGLAVIRLENAAHGVVRDERVHPGPARADQDHLDAAPRPEARAEVQAAGASSLRRSCHSVAV